MEGALIILAVLVIVGVVVRFLDIKSHHHHAPSPDDPQDRKDGTSAAEGEECCGLHAFCEKKYGSAAETPEYYDDEELDILAYRNPESFTEEELAMLRDVLMTLRSEDAPGWARSLELRHISLPPAIRDELVMLING